MKIIKTEETNPEDMTPWEREQVYNGLDCCVTHEALPAILSQMDNLTGATYAFSRELQAPVLEMRLRGVRVDAHRKNEVIEDYTQKIDRLERQLDRIVLEGVGRESFNWRSNKDLQGLFYSDLGIPTIRKFGRPTVDRGSLEKLENYLVAKQIVNHLVLLRELDKRVGVLRTEIDRDGRMRTSYNIAGTSTGRFSSSFSEFGTGTNLQNIEESLRSIFIADPGQKLAKFDAKSGESYCVGAIEWNILRDGRYLDVCESGDPHTAVARICWPALPWTGNLSQDKGIAEHPYYRHYSYRFMCKKLGHGSNYGGRPPTLAKQAKLDLSVVQDFQPKYFTAFPAHQLWHEWVRETLAEEGTLVSLTSRKRCFWGRRDSDDTFREAVAYDPQGSLADIVNRALMNIWRARTAIPLMHDHDAITVQYPAEREDEVIPLILKQLEVPIELSHGRTLLIPYDCKVGWNKGDYSEENHDGLKDYSGHDSRKRTPILSFLDRK